MHTLTLMDRSSDVSFRTSQVLTSPSIPTSFPDYDSYNVCKGRTTFMQCTGF